MGLEAQALEGGHSSYSAAFVGVRQGGTSVGLNVCRVKASGLKLMRFGNKLEKRAAQLITRTPSFPQPRWRLLLKTRPVSPRELPEDDAKVLRWVGEAGFYRVVKRCVPSNYSRPL